MVEVPIRFGTAYINRTTGSQEVIIEVNSDNPNIFQASTVYKEGGQERLGYPGTTKSSEIGEILPTIWDEKRMATAFDEVGNLMLTKLTTKNLMVKVDIR